jgi:hypothetical protein
MIEWCGPILLAVCAVLIALPPKYDPAIRLKHWFNKRSKQE